MSRSGPIPILSIYSITVIGVDSSFENKSLREPLRKPKLLASTSSYCRVACPKVDHGALGRIVVGGRAPAK